MCQQKPDPPSSADPREHPGYPLGRPGAIIPYPPDELGRIADALERLVLIHAAHATLALAEAESDLLQVQGAILGVADADTSKRFEQAAEIVKRAADSARATLEKVQRPL